MAERAAPRNLNERVAALANDALKVASSSGLDSLAGQLNEEARRWPAPEVTVLVAGETSRGKSSLINALVGRPSLLPTGAGTVSRTFVAVRRGGEDGVIVTRRSTPDPLHAPLADVADWASERGADVAGLEVTLAETALPAGVTVIDTPGVGGLEDANARATLTALGRADALLMVCDPSAPLSAPELAFIDTARRRVATVVLVMTKIDQFSGWRRLLDDDLALLERDGHGDVAVLPVSAKLGLLSLSSGDADVAASLWADSGLTPLRDLVARGLAGRSQVLRMSNLTRITQQITTAVEEPLRLRLSMYADEVSPEVASALDDERRRLDDLRDSAPRYQTWLADRFNMLREQLMNDATNGIRDLVQHYEKALPDYRRDLERLVEDVRLDLEVVEAKALEAFGVSVRESCVELATLVGGTERRDEVGGRLLSRVEHGSLRVAEPARGPDALAGLRSVSTVSGLVSSLSFLLRSSGFAGAGLIPVMFGAFVITASAGVGSLVLAARQRDLDRLRVQLRSLGDSARVEFAPMLRERALVVQRGMEDELRALLRDRTRDYQNRVLDAQNAQRSDAAERQRVRTEVTQQLRDVQRIRQEAGALAEELRTALSLDRRMGEMAVTPDQRDDAQSYRQHET